MPAAEVDLSADLVRVLLAEQHPDLAHLPVAVLANGWDNAIFRLGDSLVVRMPRREMGARILLNEQRWLPELAPRLPLPVPAPVRIGRPGHGYPWAWSVAPFLPGEPASGTVAFDPCEAAVAVGAFLGALHVPAPPEAPANPLRGVPLTDRAATFADNLRILDGQADRAAVLRVWDAALMAPRWDRAPVWLHGDPHPANILVHEGRVSGVIDFGDITAGDPATDLSVAWMLLPAAQHAPFREAYRDASGAAGAVGDPLWRRARGWALHFALVFLAYSADDPHLRQVGERTLRTVLGQAPPIVGGAENGA
jgi:aminoglycoside phosphotransferase (APT) family kinase protein